MNLGAISTEEVRRQLELLGFSNVDDNTLLKYVQQLNEQHIEDIPSETKVNTAVTKPPAPTAPKTIVLPTIQNESECDESPESNAYNFFFGANQNAISFLNDSLSTQYESDLSIPETAEMTNLADLKQGIEDLMHSPIQSVNSPKYNQRIKRRVTHSNRMSRGKALLQRPGTAGKCKRKKFHRRNSSITFAHCRPSKKRSQGFKSSDPVSLYQQFNRSWKRDKFLNKKTTRQSQSSHTLSSISIKRK